MNSQPATVVIPIIAFMAVNPDEGLTADDMVVKFGFPQRTTPYAALRRLVDEGWLSQGGKARRKRSSSAVYLAGPKLRALIGGAPT